MPAPRRRDPRLNWSIPALLVLAAAVLVAAAIYAAADEDGPPSRAADPSLGVPAGKEPEGGESEAEERTLTARQARPVGTRRAPANRVGPPVRASARAGEATPISGPSPLAGCPGLAGTITDYEAEPHLAVNPRDRRNLIATWQQDRSFAARGTVAAFSRDGGRTWRTVTVPGADTCEPGTMRLAVADPWLSFDAKGTAYLASLPGGAVETAKGVEIRASVIVNRSRDGGRTWSKPSVVVPMDGFNDKEAIAADPARAGLVYAVWEKSGAGQCQGGEECAPVVYFARSMDGAKTWSRPAVVARPATNVAQHNARILVLRDGSLRIVYEQGDFRERRRIMLTGSSDKGRTWSAPRQLFTQRNQLPTADGSSPFYAIFEEAVAADRAGRSLYVAAADARTDDARSRSTVWLMRSTDGGRTWGRREIVARPTGFAMLPSVAAGVAGRVAVSWYDYAADKPGDGLTATYRVAVREPRAARWRVTSLGAFDSTTCGKFSPPGLPGPKLPWIGEYFGLAEAGNRFVTAFIGCGKLSRRGPEDVLFAPL